MKRPTFVEGASVAVIAAVATGLLYRIFQWIFPGQAVFPFLIASIGFGYLLYLLSRSDEKTGRLSVLALWLIATLTGWMLLPLPHQMFIQIGFIWFVRTLYFHARLLASVMDLFLQAVASAAALWAIFQTGSLMLSAWTFFLLQALFTLIPRSPSTEEQQAPPESEQERRFMNAHRIAEAAIGRLSTHI